MKAVFYIVGEKGLTALSSFIDTHAASAVHAVVPAKDERVTEDHYQDICSLAHDFDIPVLDRKAAESELGDFPGYRFAIGWKWMIKSENLIVFHDSLLPNYRGFAPLVNMLINGEKQIGVTAILANDSYDSGDIFSQRSMEVNYPIKIADAIKTLSCLYAEMATEIYKWLLMEEPLELTKQDTTLASYSMWRDEQDYFINWNESSERIARTCDALGSPYGGAKCYLNGSLITLVEVKPFPDAKVESRYSHVGKVIFKEAGNPVVVCGSGLLEIIEFESLEGPSLSKTSIPFRSRFT